MRTMKCLQVDECVQRAGGGICSLSAVSTYGTGNDNSVFNIMWGIFHGIFLVPQNIVMDLNNDMNLLMLLYNLITT